MDADDERTFLVSCAFVGDGGRNGVLVTLDHMTTVERQNRELTSMVVKLRQSQEVINEKNRGSNRSSISPCIVLWAWRR